MNVPAPTSATSAVRSSLQTAMAQALSIPSALDAGNHLETSRTMRAVGRSVIDAVMSDAPSSAASTTRLVDAATGTIAAGGALHNAANAVGYLALQRDMGNPTPREVAEFASMRERGAIDDARRSTTELAGRIREFLELAPAS